MSDFIREVDEEYRRDRILGFFSRFQLLIAIAVVAVIVGAGWWRYSVDAGVAAAQKADVRLQAAEQLARDGKTQQAEAAFDDLAKTGPAGYALLAQMRAAEVVTKSDPEAGAKRFDSIADGAAGNKALADTARFRAALIRVDLMAPDAFAKKYGALAMGAYSFAPALRELIALAQIKGNDLTGAGKTLDDLVLDSKTPPAMRERARVFRDLVTGGPTTPTDNPAAPATVTPVPGTGSPAPAAVAPAPTPPSAGPTSSAPSGAGPTTQPAPSPAAH